MLPIAIGLVLAIGTFGAVTAWLIREQSNGSY
jgi:hypothetical protein